MKGSVRSAPVRPMSLPKVFQSCVRPNCARAAPEQARAITDSANSLLMSDSPALLSRQPERVQHVVERAEIHPAVSDRKPCEMAEGLDLIARVPQFLAGLRVQGVEHGVGGVLDPYAALIRAQAEFRSGLHA